MERCVLEVWLQSQRKRRVCVVVAVANGSQHKPELVCISIVNWGDVHSVDHQLFSITLHKV